jgi:ATP-dependent RNA helicase RhlE
MKFEDFDLSQTVLKAIEEQGYTTPTPIQEKCIPLLIEGNDLVGCAQTGTGKTAAFAIPIVQHLNRLGGSAKKAKKNSLFGSHSYS